MIVLGLAGGADAAYIFEEKFGVQDLIKVTNSEGACAGFSQNVLLRLSWPQRWLPVRAVNIIALYLKL